MKRVTGIKSDTAEIIAMSRPYLEVPTSLIITIKKNLNGLLKEDVQGDPLSVAAIKAAWHMEIHDADVELVKRN
jgi:hypothetical protein